MDDSFNWSYDTDIAPPCACARRGRTLFALGLPFWIARSANETIRFNQRISKNRFLIHLQFHGDQSAEECRSRGNYSPQITRVWEKDERHILSDDSPACAKDNCFSTCYNYCELNFRQTFHICTRKLHFPLDKFLLRFNSSANFYFHMLNPLEAVCVLRCRAPPSIHFVPSHDEDWHAKSFRNNFFLVLLAALLHSNIVPHYNVRPRDWWLLADASLNYTLLVIFET